MKNIALLQARQ